MNRLFQFSRITCAALSFCALQALAEVSESDKNFMHEAAQAGLAEVKAGKLAQDRSKQPEVRKFAKKMVIDHGKINKELWALAKRKQVTLPMAPNEAQQESQKKLSEMSGQDFDKTYVDQAGVKDHEEAKKLFEKGTSADDADVKAFASKNLTVIEHHLSMSKTLADKH